MFKRSIHHSSSARTRNTTFDQTTQTYRYFYFKIEFHYNNNNNYIIIFTQDYFVMQY